MTSSNIILRTAGKFGTENHYKKRANNWYKRQAETIAIYNIQKSSYGPQFYINMALWLLALGETDYPKLIDCHIQTRLEALVGDGERRLKNALNLEVALTESERSAELMYFMERYMLPIFDLSSTVEGIADRRNPIADNSLITAEAQELLETLAG